MLTLIYQIDHQQVKWGDKDGGYGEQYWDLNHGGAGESANDYVRNLNNFHLSIMFYNEIIYMICA